MKFKVKNGWILVGLVLLAAALFLLARCHDFRVSGAQAVVLLKPSGIEQPIEGIPKSAHEDTPVGLPQNSYLKVKAAFEHLAQSSSYTCAVTARNADGTKLVCLLYRSMTSEGELLRCETQSFLKNQSTADPVSKRIEIMNSKGNWEIRAGTEFDDVAFLVRESKTIPTSIGFQKTLLAMASQAPSSDHIYSESSASFGGRPVTIISEASANGSQTASRYVLDQETGEIIEMKIQLSSFSGELIFDIGSDPAHELFEIPKGKIELPTNDLNHDIAELSRMVRQKSKNQR